MPASRRIQDSFVTLRLLKCVTPPHTLDMAFLDFQRRFSDAAIRRACLEAVRWPNEFRESTVPKTT